MRQYQGVPRASHAVHPASFTQRLQPACVPQAQAGSLFPGQLNLTYSKSAGWLLMPRAGGAIQWANLPAWVTAGPINEVT